MKGEILIVSFTKSTSLFFIPYFLFDISCPQYSREKSPPILLFSSLKSISGIVYLYVQILLYDFRK